MPEKIYYKCVECGHKFDGNDNTLRCPKCNSEDIKEQKTAYRHIHNPYYTNSLFKN